MIILNEKYQKRVQELPPAIFQKELERLTIEFSWKSSHIEGNTYTLLDTELLIKEHTEAKGHTREEAVMILNHKKAFDYALQHRERFKNISIRDITDIHALLVGDMNISTGLRKKPVGIVGTVYQPLENEYQLREALEAGVEVLNTLASPFSKALAAVLLISYIQPFEDGNKRTSRLFSNAILLAQDICPLSFRSVDEGDYKKAMILFYEYHSARFFKELFIQQFQFAVENYFLA